MLEIGTFLKRYENLVYLNMIDEELSELWSQLWRSSLPGGSFREFKELLPIFQELIFERTAEIEGELDRTYDGDERFLLQNASEGIALFAHAVDAAPDSLINLLFTLLKDGNWRQFMTPLMQSYLI